MQIDIFDVEHGSCALISTPNGKHILIDAGHNSSTGWRPSSYLKSIGVSQLEHLFITNCDRDHASDLPNIERDIYVKTLWKNPTITEANIREIKGVDMSPGIDVLASMIGSFTLPVAPLDIGGIEFYYFWNRYPDQFKDENNLSLIVIFKYAGFWICFPGDMEKLGWEKLIETTPSLLEQIKGVDVLLAAHHGRENGKSELLYDRSGWKPWLTIISDSGIEHATQETVNWYAQRTVGINWDTGGTRRVLTTRSDGGMQITVNANGSWNISTNAYHMAA